MRISTEWLSEFVHVPPAEELAHLFEMAGIGVEDLEDGIFTLEVTSNRGDWLSAIGLAREIGAMTGHRVSVPAPASEGDAGTSKAPIAVEIEDAQDCARYIAREINEVRVGPSPDWMQQRLIQCGMRPINNIVDVTNYVLLETGQPLHAFDADRVHGGHIGVRRAWAGEKLVTLDGVERALDEEVLVITDPAGPLAIAGVMGGAESEVTAGTTRVLLESAHFAPTQVRRAVRRLGLSSEASRRFERWVDPNGVARAADRAAQLLRQCAHGVPAAVVDRYVQPIGDVTVSMRVARCNALLGLQLSADRVGEVLKRLGLKVLSQNDGVLLVSVPTWRRDIEREADLIEEVARIHGYDNIPTTLPQGANPSAGRSLSQRLEEHAKHALLRCGLNEVVTYSLHNEAAVERAGLHGAGELQPAVRLRNPLSEDYTQLRTSLLPSLLEVLAKNPQRQVRIFELGKVYLAQAGHKQPNERRRIGIALLDAPAPLHWQKQLVLPVDFYALKGVVQRLLHALGAPQAQYRAVLNAPFHPGRCAALSINGEDLGILGEVHPEVSARYELRHRAYLALVDFDALVRHISLARTYAPIGRFPSAGRDLAVVLPHEVPAATLEATVRSAAGTLLESVQIFDVYTGPPIPANFKSLALALRFRATDRTLTDDEVNTAMQAVIHAVERELNAKLRA